MIYLTDFPSMMDSQAINNLNLDDSCIPLFQDRNRIVEFNLKATHNWLQCNESLGDKCLSRRSEGILKAHKRQAIEMNYSKLATSFY
jgi:hypothetical protein